MNLDRYLTPKFWQSFAFRVLVVFTTTAFAAGCLPKDDSNTESSTGDTTVRYSGFTGAATAETVASNRVKVTWTQATDSKVVAYNVYDATSRFNPRFLRTVNAPADSVTLSGLAEGQYYTFRVRAANADNVEDENTNDLPAIPYGGLVSASVVSSTSANLNITSANNTDADQVNIYCKTATDTNYTQVATIRNFALTSALVTGLTPAVEYMCRAAIDINGFVDNNDTIVRFTPMGQASQITFTTQPGNAPAGSPLIVQPVVKITDSNGNVVSGGPDATAQITLTVATTSPTAGTVRGTATVSAVAGIATFTDINFQEAGVKILTATKEDKSGEVFGAGTLTVNSNNFTINAGAVSAANSSIAISPAIPPGSVLTANGSDAYSVIITLQDMYGNAVTGIKPVFSSSLVGDSLTQPAQNTNSSGQSTGSISSTVADSFPPYRMLSITSPSGLSSVQVAAPFKPGVATKLAFTTQPVNSPAGIQGMAPLQVMIQDAQGNRIVDGTASTSDIALSIASNTGGAFLSGTTTQTAAVGISAFNDLGIDKTATGYRLIASSGSLTPAYSNTFNITAGVPKKIQINGPATLVSGTCSTAITVQLQDNGSNPANAIQNTPVTLSGLGSAAIYSSSTCSGSPLSSTLTYTAGSNIKTIYLKDVKAEALSIVAVDSSAVLTAGTLSLKSTPSKVSLLAQASGGGTLSVVSGQCSTEIIITPMGDNGNAGPTFAATPISVTGLVGSPATIYSDSGCTVALDPLNVTLPVTSGTNYTTKIYLKDVKAETLLLSLSDPNGVLATTSGPQTVNITASKIDFTGPTSVVAGQCSAAFTIHLQDEQGNNVAPTADTTINIDGIGASEVGRFFTSPACSGGGSRTTLTYPQSATALLVYFKSTVSGIYTLRMMDPAAKMATSQTIVLGVSPSALQIVAPGAGSSKTNVCVGPFQVNTLDSVGTATNAITPINVNLTGQGAAGGFYSDNTCATSITSLQIATGTSQKLFYFSGYFPEPTLSLTATDAASVLTAASANWVVTSAQGWLGTSSTDRDSGGNFLWFRTGAKPVSARYDGARSVWRVKFDPTYRYMYLVDYATHRILKYDYLNKTYIGWIGRFWNNGGINISGSNLATPSNAQCVATVSGNDTPGWCVGGQSTNANTGNGSMDNPMDLHDDGTYIYVVNYGQYRVNRYVSATGAFAGWIGWVNTTPTAAATGGPSSCTSTSPGNVTPGWCMGGSSTGAGTYWVGDGRMLQPMAITGDSSYIYVTNRGAVLRYSKSSGTFAGWIGMANANPTGGTTGCTATSAGQITPGWCTGGSYQEANPRGTPAGGFYYPRGIVISGTDLYVSHNDYNGVIAKYNAASGAFSNLLPGLTYNYNGLYGIDTDGTYFYGADYNRILLLDNTGLVNGWIGKVANNSSMSGYPGCSTIAINANTPGWCLGGSARTGVDEKSFHEARSVTYDGAGKIIVAQGGNYPAIKRYDAATGVYEGSLSLESTSPSKWSNDGTAPAEYYGYDDKSMYNPSGMYISGNYMYMAERSTSRIKKIDRRTGELAGWIGAITSTPTGGDAGCTTANPYAASPGWCLGASFLPDYLWGTSGTVSTTSNGVVYQPMGVTGDGTYLYVTDYGLHRVSRFKISDGTPQGWIGRISSSPTGGDPGCNGAAAGTFTPGWCTGGVSTNGTGDGNLWNPTGIVFTGGNLYVMDFNNHRISSYVAASGAFNGWIGRTNATPASNCTYASNGTYTVTTSGWCKGGTSQEASTSDRGGGFAFWNRGGISTDGTYLYIANFRNIRIDKYTLGGVYSGSARTREDVFTGAWSTDPTTVSAMGTNQCSYPIGVWVDSGQIYGLNTYPCNRNGDTIVAFKMGVTSGQISGWQGGIDSSTTLPNAGEAGCAGATVTTPGWCQGGRTALGVRMGQYGGIYGSISGDQYYIYISDESGNRVTRFPR